MQHVRFAYVLEHESGGLSRQRLAAPGPSWWWEARVEAEDGEEDCVNVKKACDVGEHGVAQRHLS